MSEMHHTDCTFGDYDGTTCRFCGRQRVMVGAGTGRRICEKCERYQDTPASPPPGEPVTD